MYVYQVCVIDPGSTCLSGAQRGPLRDNQSVLIMRQILRGAAREMVLEQRYEGREV